MHDGAVHRLIPFTLVLPMRNSLFLLLAAGTLAACGQHTSTSGTASDGGGDAPDNTSMDSGDASLGTPTGNFLWEIHTSMGLGTSISQYVGVAAGNANAIAGSFGAGASGTIGGVPWTGEGLVGYAMNTSEAGIFANSLAFAEGQSGAPDIAFSRMAQDGNGDLYLCGSFNQASVSFNTVANGMVTLTNPQPAFPADMLIKVQGTTGQVLWANTLAVSAGQAMFGSSRSVCRAVAAEGTTVVAAYSFGGSLVYSLAGVPTEVDAGGAGDFDGLLTSIDPATGQTLWAKHLGGSSVDAIYSTSIDGSGNVYMGAYTQSPSPTIDGVATTVTNTVPSSGVSIIFEFDATTHAVSFAQGFHPTGTGLVIINALAAAPDGDIAACGYFGGPVDFGTGTPTPSNAQDDGYVVRLSKTTGTEWVDAFAGPLTDRCDSLAIDPTDQIVIGIGYGSTGLMIDTHALPAPVGGMAGSVVKLSSAGKYLWSDDLVGTGAEVWSVAIFPPNSVLYAGAFTGGINLGDGTVNGGDSMSASYFAVLRSY